MGFKSAFKGLLSNNTGNVGINITMRRVGVNIVAVQKY